MGEDFEGGLTLYFNKLNDFGYAKMKEVEYPHYYPFTEKQLWDFSVPSYLNLNHNYVLSSEPFGFAKDQEEIAFLKEQFKSLQEIFPGELIDDPNSEEYMRFEEEYEVPENPMVIEN